MHDRSPRTNDYQHEQPDAPGKWWFQGKAVTAMTVTHVQNRPFEVIIEEGKLTLCVIDTGDIFQGPDLIGWWTRDEDM